MTVYNLNIGIGWASSGVEYAQAYRSNIFQKLNIASKFIYTDMILHENIAHLTNNLGIPTENVIWLYQAFSDIPVARTSYTLKELLESLPDSPIKEEQAGKRVRYFFSDTDFVTAYLVNEEDDYVQRVEFVSNGKLIRKDYYSYTRVMTEYYSPEDGRAKVHLRRFFNQDGSPALEEYIDEDRKIYRQGNHILFSEEELLSHYLGQLDLTNQDLILIDRATGIGPVVLRDRGDARVGVVVHAEHYSENMTDTDHILWNNYYEFTFEHALDLDFIIVSTDVQNQILTQQFRDYKGYEPRIITIPVGSVDRLKYPSDHRRPYSMMTASRLAGEKHIDWLIEAVAQVHHDLPDLQFDIYGKGSEEAALKELIEQLDAEDYIHLKGHQDLSDVYQNYDLYLTASTSEGFGLSLLEAIASGLPIIGFDVPYGNPTFVDHGLNGYLIKRNPIENHHETINHFVRALTDYFNNHSEDMHRHSYKKAEVFLTEEIEKRWQRLVEEA